MAELTPFAFRPGASMLHRIDPRFKLIGLIGASLAVLNSHPAGLGLGSLATGILLASIRFPLPALIREYRYFGLLILLVFISQTLSTGGEPVVRFWGVAVTRQGLMAGGLAAWRLGLVVALGLLLTTTTRPWQIKAAVESLLSPVPFIPRKRVAFMMGLLLRFIPLIFSAARETADAQRARSIENRRNPLFRLVKRVIPLMRRIFLDADRLTTAMEARCYTEERTTPPLTARTGDWAFLTGVCILSAILLLLPGP